jgi:hypothetical protein
VFNGSVGPDHPEPGCVVFKLELEVLAGFLGRCDKFVAKLLEASIPLVEVYECPLELASSFFIGFLENVDVVDNAKGSSLDGIKHVANSLFVDVEEHPRDAKAGLVGCTVEGLVGSGRHGRLK